MSEKQRSCNSLPSSHTGAQLKPSRAVSAQHIQLSVATTGGLLFSHLDCFLLHQKPFNEDMTKKKKTIEELIRKAVCCNLTITELAGQSHHLSMFTPLWRGGHTVGYAGLVFEGKQEVHLKLHEAGIFFYHGLKH